ncbi:hypothetical protein [Lacticaseibacillus mingshuiensis]|uniref:hypothetical protein n=1 Tax=Lacticaseibacillus mingshuiensis TaxID=2799574 RepID=UPI001951AA7E|nr:hypothetical protein [Lacticaseibacillus mingshuiensis]
MAKFPLPGYWNLFKATGLPPFDQSAEGSALIKKYNETAAKTQSTLSIYRVAFWLCVIIIIWNFFMFTSETGGSLGVAFICFILLFVFRGSSFLGRRASRARSQAREDMIQGRYRYTDKLLKAVVPLTVNGKYWTHRYGDWGLLYGSTGCTFVNQDTGTLVAYSNENIKHATREHLHTGSSTSTSSSSVGTGTMIGDTGVMVGGSTGTSSSDTTDYYEWRLDILSNFVDYPKISIVLPDTERSRDFTGNVVALLD